MAENSARTLVFLPTYNDRELLMSLTSGIQALGPDFRALVIDDGSQQPIRKEEVATGTLLVRVPANFGLGMATHIAFDHALAHGYFAVVRIDADGQHPVEMTPNLVREIFNHTADIVVGERTNRDHRTGPRELVSRLVRRYLSKVARLMTNGQAPDDVNSGFFAANLKAAEKLNSYSLDRFPEPQMYTLAPRNGLVLRSLKIEQTERQYGQSTVTLGHAVRLFYRFNIFILAELLQRSGIR
jgi:glycosyltransferase involved in cell wall biosynthesis